MIWKKLLKRLKKQTSICKPCFKGIKYTSFHKLLFGEEDVCDDCIYASNPVFKEFEIDGIKAMTIYEYDEYMKTKIFTYKGCLDYELKDMFISPFLLEIRLRFSDYSIVPIPSYVEDDKKRGYNNVIEIFKSLKLPIINCLIKTKDIKQKEQNYEHRQEIKKYIEFDYKYSVKNKKILIVDDIITTGASMRAAIALMRNNGVKDIKILSIAKRELNEDEILNMKNIKKL